MQFSLTAFASWATVIGTIISVLALVQSSSWLLLISLLIVCLSIGGILYGRQKRLALESASIVIEGHSIDSLNIANLRRRLNRTFFIQEAEHIARIEGEDLEITWKYSGYCRADKASAMEFSIDSDAGVSFDQLNCRAFDLGHDREMKHPVQPLLVGPEGTSKKISVLLLKPVVRQEPFGILLKATLPRCIKRGFSYYTSTLSFAQGTVRRCVVRLQFVGAVPAWVRVYECLPQKQPALIKSLAPSRQEPGITEYVDEAGETAGNSARIYIFQRDNL